VENPDIRYKDSLSESENNDEEKFSLILANPPFSGSLDYESTSKDLLQTVKTKKTELLFLALFEKILEHGGRAAVVVPAGVLESDSKAHTQLRQKLVEDLNLEAVIKLPHWVFKPYASVDTSILLFSKRGKTEHVWFYRVDNDGFLDDAQKSEVAGSDIPELLELWKNKCLRANSDNISKHRSVPLSEIRQNSYDLCPPMYLSGHSYPAGAQLEKLGDIFDISKGTAAAASALDEGEFPFITSALSPRRSNNFAFEGEAICIPTVSATGHGHASIKTIHLVDGKFDASSITAVLIPKTNDIPVRTIFYYLLAHKEELLVPLMRGATNKSLNVDRLAELQVPILLPQSEEGSAVERLIELREEISEMKAKISLLEKLHEDGVTNLGRK